MEPLLQECVNRYQDGEKLSVIEKESGIYRQKIIRTLKREGIQLRGCKRLSLDQEKEICNRYQNLQKIPFLASEYDVSIPVIRRVLRDHSVETRSNAEEHRVYPIKEDVFRCIDEEWKAYFLGLLFADGCNYQGKRLTLSLTGNDEKRLMEEICAHLYETSPYPISSTGDCHRLTIVNFTIAQDALKLGLVPRKTYGCDFPNLPEQFVWHFVRGYFDGDGGTHLQRQKKKINVSIVGCRAFLDGMAEHMRRKDIQLSIYPTKSFAEMIRFSSKKSIDIFYHLIYNDATIWLNRKREKFKDWYYATDYAF